MRKYIPRYKKPKSKKPKKTVKKQTVKQIVKKELAKQIENKEVCNTDQYYEFYINGAGSITNSTVSSLNPIITQSVGENGRIGNSVVIKSAVLRGYLTLAPTGTGDSTRTPAFTGQYNVRLFIGKLKSSIDAPTTAQFNQLLRVGAATFAFDSTNQLSQVRRVNTELFTIYYDRMHKIGVQNGPNNTVSGIHNNDYKLSKMITINLTKYLKKKLIFLDTTINTPTNSGLYIFGACTDSLGSNFVSLIPACSLTYDLQYSYEDA